MTFLKHALAATLGAAAVLATTPADAAMTLTATALTQGWSLSTFASGLPSSGYCCGPLGLEFPTTGGVLVANFTGPVYFFPTNADNQTVANATVGSTFGASQPVDLTLSGGQIYMANQGGNAIHRLGNTGANQGTLTTSIPLFGPTGLATNPITGHIYVSTLTGNNGIYEINPADGATTLLQSGSFDGLTVSQDGRHLFAADFNSVRQYSTGVNGAPPVTEEAVFNFADSVDGTALGTGTLAGYLFANANSGNFYQVEIATGTITLLASGGSRGDFVQVDPSNGTLLITQTDSVLRLTAPEGGGFEGTVPEPGTLALFGAALASLGTLRRRARRSA